MFLLWVGAVVAAVLLMAWLADRRFRGTRNSGVPRTRTTDAAGNRFQVTSPQSGGFGGPAGL